MTSTIETEDVVADWAANTREAASAGRLDLRDLGRAMDGKWDQDLPAAVLGRIGMTNEAFDPVARAGDAIRVAFEEKDAEIERLREENARLRDALLTLADENSWRGFSPVPQIARMRALARAALNQQ